MGFLPARNYGTGSSRGLGPAKRHKIAGCTRAVIAESFERIHRSNLVGMGVAPLQFAEGDSWAKLKLDGSEKITIEGLDELKTTPEDSDGHRKG